MSDVKDQYEAYPYPARDPRDEAKRLITGSPSFPVEMDHHLWGGARDWSTPLRVLVAGGGTGDGLVQLAQRMAEAGRPYDILYLDLSSASRRIAEARIAARGLEGVRFESGSLLDAADYGAFDYIDCCGVLHHLPDPAAGLGALGAALAPGGGLGFMVYAPYGRSGVYPLQAAFNRLYGHLPPKSRLKHAKATFDKVPEGHPLRRNATVGDHKQGDAGFFDLLLHSQDQAFDIAAWAGLLQDTGWTLAGLAQAGLYDLSRLATVPAGMDAVTQMATAEELRGTIKTHVGYARRVGEAPPPVPAWPDRVPHISGGPVQALAQAIEAGKLPPLRIGGESVVVRLRPEAAPMIRAADGQRSLGEIAALAGMAEREAAKIWNRVEAELVPWGLLHYSRILRC